jgi:hypothetical protein
MRPDVRAPTTSESCCHVRFRVLELQNGHRVGSILYVSMALTMLGKVWLPVLPAKPMPRSIIQANARITAESGAMDTVRAGGTAMVPNESQDGIVLTVQNYLQPLALQR